MAASIAPGSLASAIIICRKGQAIASSWCRELIPGYLNGITGAYQTPKGYDVDDTDLNAFARQFPPKKKRKMPCKLFDGRGNIRDTVVPGWALSLELISTKEALSFYRKMEKQRGEMEAPSCSHERGRNLDVRPP